MYHWIVRCPPLNIDGDEIILRGVLGDEKTLTAANTVRKRVDLFAPPSSVNDSGISVIRGDYSTIAKSKMHCKAISSNKKQYLGFLYFPANVVRSTHSDGWESDVISTPDHGKDYPFSEHADIIFKKDGEIYVKQRDKTIDPAVKAIAQQFVIKMKEFVDPKPNDQHCPSFVDLQSRCNKLKAFRSNLSSRF